MFIAVAELTPPIKDCTPDPWPEEKNTLAATAAVVMEWGLLFDVISEVISPFWCISKQFQNVFLDEDNSI